MRIAPALALLAALAILAGCSGAPVAVEPPPTTAPATSPTPTPTPTPSAETAAPTPDPSDFTAVDPALFSVKGAPQSQGWSYDDVNFVSPSGNLGCAILDHGGDTWGCKIGEKNWEFPSASPDDYCFDAQIYCGNGIEAQGQGAPHPYMHSDPGFPAGLAIDDNTDGWVRVLQYGEMVTFNGVTCFSEEAAVTCENSASGHGFVISRDVNEIY